MFQSIKAMQCVIIARLLQRFFQIVNVLVSEVHSDRDLSDEAQRLGQLFRQIINVVANFLKLAFDVQKTFVCRASIADESEMLRDVDYCAAETGASAVDLLTTPEITTD